LGKNVPEFTKYDPETLAAKAITLAKTINHQEIVLHGGEPLLWNIKHLHKFMDIISKAGYRIAIQTNGSLITDKHIQLFRKYNVSVGVSIDGFPDIGYARGLYNERGEPLISKEVNERIVSNVLRNIEKLVKNGINVGVIIVLSKYNFGDDSKIDRLAEFIKYLRKIGVTSGRLNPVFGFGRIEPYELSWKDLLYGYKLLWYKIRDLGVSYSPYVDISKALLGNFRDVVCWFHGCGFFDSFVWTITPYGTIAPCDRALGFGKIPLRADIYNNPIANSKIRVYALLQTELKNSRNGHIHRGGCPSESPNGDWRHPSRFWRTWDELIEFMSEEIRKIIPNIKLPNNYPNKLEFVEKIDRGCAWNIWRGGFACPQSR